MALFSPASLSGSITKNSYEGVIHNSVAEWSGRRTRKPVVLGSSPAMATCWICSRQSRAQILGHACKQPNGCLLPIGILHSFMLYLNYLFFKCLLIVKRFGSLRERRYISVYYYYYYYYYYYLQKHSSNCIKLFLLRLFHPLLSTILFPSSRCKSRSSSRM